MKKYYIPTSTLNFNNILSSESVSPKAFYTKRGFGYSRWTTIPENGFDNAIVLYESIKAFDRPKGELEDHSLLIETHLKENFIKQGDGFLYCDSTIFLTPSTTRFLFFSESERRIALSMSENSLESKLLKLYSKRIDVVTKPQETYQPIVAKEPCALNEAQLEYDIHTNKMKGALYGYYIGSLLSSDKESIKQLNELKEIHDIFAAVNSSIDRKATPAQYNRLNTLFSSINTNSPLFKGILSITNNLKQTNDILNIIKKEYGYLRNFEDLNNFLYQLQNNAGDGTNPSILWIKSKIEDLKSKMRQSSTFLSPNKREIVVSNNKLNSVNNDNLSNRKDIDLFCEWINDTLSDRAVNGKISSYREELATKLTLKAKEVYSDTWENCETRSFMNDLRRHIAGDSFNHEWNNGLLSSIAAVIIAGNEWDKLLSFMQSKGMADYRIAFSFFGIINGYANLTRDFTDLLYEQSDKDYVWSIYKEIYKQLSGDIIETPISINKTENVGEVISSTLTTPQELVSVFECDAFKTLPIDAQNWYKTTATNIFIQQGNSVNIYDLLINLSNECPVKKTKTKWEKCLKTLKPQKPRKIKTKTDHGETLTMSFGEQSGLTSKRLFFNDNLAWNIISKYIPEELQSDIKIDFDWFQNEYGKGDRSDFYAKASRRNDAVLAAYKRHFEKRYPHINVSLMFDELKAIYGN